MASTHSQVQLFIKCKGLLDTDTLSKSDPYAIVFDVTDGGRTMVGRTEVIKNSVNPNFQTPITMNYFFEVKQIILVELWDKDKGKSDDFLGSLQLTVGSIVSSRGSTITSNLSTKGVVTITASTIGMEKGMMIISFRGRQLKKMDFFGKSDPYFVLSRRISASQKKRLYCSEVIKGTLDPQWKSTRPLDLVDLCGGDTVSPCVAFDCFDKDLVTDDAMGGFVVSVEQLMSPKAEFELVKVKDNGKRKSYGFISVDTCDYQKMYSFLEYLQGGLQINIAFSIDFTASNGDPRDPRSLHYIDPVSPNEYIRAMLAVSDVVQEYDSDRLFPVYGFGAVTSFSHGTSHFFPLTGDPAGAYVNGMQSVIDTYATLLPQLRLSGPTNFAPTIRAIAEGARQTGNVYTILMIITDGAITDINDTIDELVAADDAPLSLIIIGVGDADFTSMERLDSDVELLKDRRGRITRRDLVQFVPFRKFANKSPAVLTAEVLHEVPRQVEQWGHIAGVAAGEVQK